MKVVLIDKQFNGNLNVPPPSLTIHALGPATKIQVLQISITTYIGMPVADIIRYLICCLGKQPYQVVNSGVMCSRTN